MRNSLTGVCKLFSRVFAQGRGGRGGALSVAGATLVGEPDGRGETGRAAARAARHTRE